MREKINIFVFVSHHLARAENGWRKNSQAMKWIQVASSTMPSCRWPNTNNTPLTRAAKTIGGRGVAVGSAGVPVAYCGLFAIFVTQKTIVSDSATEDQYFPPNRGGNSKNVIFQMVRKFIMSSPTCFSSSQWEIPKVSLKKMTTT